MPAGRQEGRRERETMGWKEGERDLVSLDTFACASISKVIVVYVKVWCGRLLVYEPFSY